MLEELPILPKLTKVFLSPPPIAILIVNETAYINIDTDNGTYL